MKQILDKIRIDLKKEVEEEYRIGCFRFFKEQIKLYGVRTNKVRKIANNYFKQIKNLDKKEIFKLCEELLKSNYSEEATIAFAWVVKLEDRYEISDFDVFESWLKNYVTDWAKCDDFCTHSFGYLLLKYPELMPKINNWTSSKNRWFRRASAVILIPVIKKEKDHLSKKEQNNNENNERNINNRENKSNLNKVFKIATILMHDKDDLVQKGYGWMLKEASNIYPNEIFEFVLKHKKEMPRTALRYAIEKYTQDKRKIAMSAL